LPRPFSIINPCSKATTAKKGTSFAPFRSFSEQPMPGRRLMAVDKLIGDNAGKAAVRKRGETIRGRGARQGPIVNKQLSLFSTDTVGPAGLRSYPEIIAPSMEHDLIERIRGLPLVPFQFGAYEGKRRIASFGFKYDYTLKRLQEAEEVPEWLAPAIEKVEGHGGPATRIRQVLCTEYDVGVGIGWHRDKPHFDEVFGLSLGSACRFRFRRKIGEKWERFTLDAEPRSLYVMTGESRHVWQHSIPPVEAPRYSITFRSMAG
jgi:hypothetical protein